MVKSKILDFYHRRKVLITGGAGFIGSNLSKALVDAGAHVTILDNFSTGNVENLNNVLHKIELIVGDIRSKEDCGKAVADKSVIFHMAAIASVPEAEKNPQKCKEINVMGTKTLFSATADQKLAPKIIFSSSAAVYGDHKGVCRESIKPNPLSIYAVSKLEGERLCQNYCKRNNACAIALRYFNVYGKTQAQKKENSGVIATFTAALKSGCKITFFGDGSQMRDYVHVSKVVDANMVAAASIIPEFDIFNVASGKSISLTQLIRNLEKETGLKNVGIEVKPERSGDIMHSLADCSKLKKLLKSTQ
ncbi:NAD-dependent epimerase/dehydratase family protein [Candidatus Dependentiae bacterium]